MSTLLGFVGTGLSAVAALHAGSWLLLGDETAMPAIGQVLAAIGDTVPTDVVVEVGSAAAQRHLATTDSTRVCHLRRDRDGRPGDSLVQHVGSLAAIDRGTHVWAAGEAAAMQAIRKELRGRLSVERDHMTVRGYWKLDTPRPRPRDGDTARPRPRPAT